MDHFAGLDVSVKETSVCIVDDAGRLVREVKLASEPEALLRVLANPAYHFKRIGLEAGHCRNGFTAHWPKKPGLPMICVETRHMRAVLKAQINKTDRNDARGMAQMMRVVTQPCRQSPKVVASFILIDLLVAARRCRGLLARPRIEPQCAVECVVPIFEFKEDLISLLLILEIGSVEGLQEIEIEVSLGLCGGTFVGRAKEKIAAAASAPFSPLYLMLPNAIAGDIRRSVGVFEHYASESVEVVAVQAARRRGSLPRFSIKSRNRHPS